MTITNIAHKTQRTVVDNSPAILTALGVGGVISTSYLAHKVGYSSAEKIHAVEDHGGTAGNRKQRFKERFGLVWKNYIPVTISGVLTIGSIVAGARASSKRTAVAVSLLTVAERGFDEYKSKVIETIGEKKEQAVRDQVVADRIKNNPPPATVIIGSGSVVCHEAYSGRYFMCDVETIRRAVNEINAKLNKHDDATLTDFYYLVGLPVTSASSFAGWQSSKQLELEWSTTMTDDQRPCVSFDYNYIHPF